MKLLKTKTEYKKSKLQTVHCGKVWEIFAKSSLGQGENFKKKIFKASVSDVSVNEKVWQWGGGGRYSPKQPC